MISHRYSSLYMVSMFDHSIDKIVFVLWCLICLSHERLFGPLTRRVDRFSIRWHTLNNLSKNNTVQMASRTLI